MKYKETNKAKATLIIQHVKHNCKGYSEDQANMQLLTIIEKLQTKEERYQYI